MKRTIILLSLLFIFLAGCVPGFQENSSKLSGVEKIKVPEGFTVELVAGPDLIDFPMFAMVDETGRLFVFESTGNVYDKTQDALENPQFRIKLLTDVNGDGVYDKSTIFADRVGFPQGGVFYKGSLYATSAPDLLKFTDTDGNGVADKREVLLSGWVLNINANSLIGPFMGPDGWLYMTSAIEGFDVKTQEGVRLKGETARIWRVRPDGSGLEWISAGGMNNPVELTFTEAGEPIGTETYFTNPTAGQRDALVYWTEGGVYPKPNDNIQRDSLVRTGELMPVISKYSRVSPAGISRYRNTILGNDFKDNLFSAQFNTHRIIRHKVFREGASFRTEDETFFSTDNVDFHPTDVLEDADGSLLVVETGGWFIKGCPLSQVSKPELKGGIYRVRKKGAPTIADPYGNQVPWSSISREKAAEYVTDPRPFIRDRALQWLVDHSAEPSLSGLIHNSPSVDARTQAVFALYRIGTPEALKSMREGLMDADVQVRVAAARAAGLAKDTDAVDKLIELIRKDEPAVRRQAATALGQIGPKKASQPLLTAAETTEDRFIQHAIINSLIILNEPEQLMPAVNHSSPQVRQVALVALDQMPSSPLRAGHVISFLESDNAALKRTALWVASHHPEWSDDLDTFLRNRFLGPTLLDEEKELFGRLLVAFCGDAVIQKFIADQMQGKSKEKLFLLHAMGECRQKEFPLVWMTQVQKILVSENDPEVQAAALELIRLRGITSLTDPLRQLANNKNKQVLLRMEALAALLDSHPALTDLHFDWLYDQLNEKDPPTRLKAASMFAQSKLSEEQLLQLATQYLPHADAFILPRLVPLFKGEYSSKIGGALATALMKSPSLDSYTEENLLAVFKKYPEDVKVSVDQLMIKLKDAHAERLERIQTLESQIGKGIIENGRKLFFGKAVCGTCHTIGPEGGTLGPDLTSIQKDRSPHDLIEAILYPGLSFVREYETYRVSSKPGDYTGIIQEQNPSEIVLGTTPQTSVRIPRTEIESMEILDVSVMPQGLDKLLTTQELADLMAFIVGQDQDPETDEHILR